MLPNGIESFNPLPELNKTGDLDVRTYSLIAQLVGRQKVDKKGANQGGDGGSDFAVRDLFKLVGYWNPSLKTDKDGKEISFDVKAGDTVLLPKYGGTEVKIGDKKLQLVREEDLLGVVEK